MSPVAQFIMERLAWVAIAGGLASLPMLVLVGWRGWLGMAAILPFLALVWIIGSVL